MEEKVNEIDLPQSSVGAPMPVVLSSEHDLYVAYYLQNTPEGWDGTSVRIMSDIKSDEPVAIVKFPLYKAYLWGPPNDEAFAGHPLASKGLEPYGTFIIENSKWIEYYEKMNSVHPYHKKEYFEGYKHFIFSFHDTTLEVISESYEFEIIKGSLRDARKIIVHKLEW